MKKDLYQEITDRIVKDLESGSFPWEKPWTGGFYLPRNGNTLNEYSGMNVWLLSMTKAVREFESNLWLTFKQGNELGAYVRKGERATTALKPTPIVKTVEDKKTGEEKKIQIPFFKPYPLFNACQFEGLASLLKIEKSHVENKTEPAKILDAEKLIEKSGADIRYAKQDRAFYRPSEDFISLPERNQFKTQLGMYEVIFHELTHWTGHKSRLDRSLENGFGSQNYAKEELVAEMGAAFLCGSVGLEYTTQHAGYVENWLKVLKDDKRFVFKAAAAAQKSADLIINNKGE